MKIKEILHYVINFIFPNRCIICDKLLPFGSGLHNEFLCLDCKDKIEFIEEPFCKKCNAKIYEKDEGYCENCKKKIKENSSNYLFGMGLLKYNDFVKESIHKIKYNSKKEYLYFYGKLLAKAFYKKIDKIKADCFVPTPIYKDRLRERNFNQSEVLAKVISNQLKNYDINVPVNTKLIKRIKKTIALNKLSDAERVLELNNAFLVDNNENIKKVIIVDDIYTTGATIEAMSKILKDNGVSEIYFMTIAVVDNL